jgi:hypothetical protein
MHMMQAAVMMMSFIVLSETKTNTLRQPSDLYHYSVVARLVHFGATGPNPAMETDRVALAAEASSVIARTVT